MGTNYYAINKEQKRYIELYRLEKTVHNAALLYAFAVNPYNFGEIRIVEDDYFDSWQDWNDVYDDCVAYLEGSELRELAFSKRDDLIYCQAAIDCYDNLLRKIEKDISGLLFAKRTLLEERDALRKTSEHIAAQQDYKSVTDVLDKNASQLNRDMDEVQRNIDSLEQTKNYILKYKYLVIKAPVDKEHKERQVAGRSKILDGDQVLGYWPIFEDDKEINNK